MKIKKQISLLITGIILLPVISMIVFSVYAYLTSPRRFLIKSYDEVRKLNEADLSEDNWDRISSYIERIPPEVQVIIFYDPNKVVFSTIPEIKSGTECELKEIFDFARSTNSQYDYQFQSLFSGRRHRMRDMEGYKKHEVDPKGKEGMIISRYIPAERKEPKIFPKFMKPLFLSALIFEAFSIVLIVFITKSVSDSIETIQKTTRKIASGELDSQIEIPGKRNSNEILALAEDLEHMRCSLKEDQERRSRFIMGISHDLRTPVALIKGYSEAISDGVMNTDEGIKKSALMISTKADTLESMINDLIDYVKINNSEWKKKQEQVEIKAFLEDFASNMNCAAELYQREIIISIDIEEQFVMMDKTLFSRALENLFGNALRYTVDGDSISLLAKKNTNGKIEVSIKDSGIGIPEEDLNKVFELFYRGTNSRREKGMGIGLSVVKTIIDSHGWSISVESQHGKGTVFTIII